MIYGGVWWPLRTQYTCEFDMCYKPTLADFLSAKLGRITRIKDNHWAEHKHPTSKSMCRK